MRALQTASARHVSERLVANLYRAPDPGDLWRFEIDLPGASAEAAELALQAFRNTYPKRQMVADVCTRKWQRGG